jgi:hypothetical protein
LSGSLDEYHLAMGALVAIRVTGQRFVLVF